VKRFRSWLRAALQWRVMEARATDKTCRLYRECAGGVVVESRVRVIAGAFPIRRLELSRYP
jgi:hypothetical protein